MLYTLRFFSSKCSLFHNANLFGSCIIHILYTGVLKIKKKKSGAKGLIEFFKRLGSVRCGCGSAQPVPAGGSPRFDGDTSGDRQAPHL